MSKSFVHLHVHSEFSILDGLGTVDDYVKRAVELEQPAIALTDHGVLCGAPSFYHAARKAGIEPLLGEEFYMVPDAAWRPTRGNGEKVERFHVVLLAKGRRGYQVLSELSTETNRHYYYKPLLDRAMVEALGRDTRHLVCLSGCANSMISKAAINHGYEAAVEEMYWWREMFPNFYIELQHHDTDFDRNLNSVLLRIARRHSIPWVVTNDPHYVIEEDDCHHDALLAIQTASDVDDPLRFRFDGSGYHLRSRQEMYRAFRDYGEDVWKPGVASTLAIARACKTRIPEWESRTWHIPHYPDADDPQAELERLAREGLEARGLSNNQIYKERVDHELRVFAEVGIADFLLITLWCIDQAKRIGIPVGPGRGSVCGTLVGFLVGIHKIDPIKYDLLFERFLNPARPRMPDIDTDFGQARRGEIFSIVEEKFGRENVVGVAAYGKMMHRKAFQSLARAHGIEYQRRLAISKNMPKRPEDGEDILPAEIHENYPELAAQLNRLSGVRSELKNHPAGVIIASPEHNLRKLVPEMWLASGKRMCGQYDLDAVEEMGLMKEDFLGLRTLDTIALAVQSIKERTGEDIDPDSWIPDEEEGDERVYQMLAEGGTSGVFQMEGGTNTRGIIAVNPGCFEDVVSCFPPHTRVQGSGVEAGIVSQYEGNMLTLHFASGKHLSVTPNHPLLTPYGWVAAGKLNIGNQLLRSSSYERNTIGDPEIHNVPTQISKVIKSLNAGSPGKRTSCVNVNLHGYRPASDVQIVWSDSLLRDSIESSFHQSPINEHFKLADLTEGGLPGSGFASLLLNSAHCSPSTFSSSHSPAPSFAGGHRGVSDNAGRRHMTHVNTSSYQSSDDSAVMAADPSSDGLGAFPINITIDNIVDIEVRPYSGQVMTLSTKSGHFIAEGIIAHNCTALYRTGPILAGYPDQFLHNREIGKRRIQYTHPLLKPILERTFGVILYQEQCMEIGKELAGFDDAGQDEIKEAIKHKKSAVMTTLKPLFVRGCRETHGIPSAISKAVWKIIEGYAGYGYNRSHAVAYTFLTYQTARLRCLYPVEFFAALLATVDDPDKIESYRRDCLGQKIKLLRPCVRRGGPLCRPEGDRSIRFGWSDIKGVGPAACAKLERSLPEDGYASLSQVEEAVRNVGVVSALADAGALEALGIETTYDRMETVLGWQFKDNMRRYREQYRDTVDFPHEDGDWCTIVGEVTKVVRAKTKTGKDFVTWTVQWAPNMSWNVRLWSETERHWNTPKGSVVQVQGKYESNWGNVSVGNHRMIKVIKKKETNVRPNEGAA